MKKLRLKALSLGAREILSREQLRSITGGCNNGADCASGICGADNTCQGDSGGSGSGSGSGCGEGEAPCGSCGCLSLAHCDLIHADCGV